MSTRLEIKTRCRRCNDIFLLPPGANLTDYCAPCRRFTGQRMDDARRHLLNQNAHFYKHVVNPGPNREFVFMGHRFRPPTPSALIPFKSR